MRVCVSMNPQMWPMSKTTLVPEPGAAAWRLQGKGDATAPQCDVDVGVTINAAGPADHGWAHVCFSRLTPNQCSIVIVAFWASISRQERWPSRAIRSNARSAASLESGLWPIAMMYSASMRKCERAAEHRGNGRLFALRKAK